MGSRIVKYGYVFEQTLAAIQSDKTVVIHKGGTGSGKTYDLMMLLVYFALNQKNKIITVVSESFPHLEIGAIRYAHAIIQGFGITDEVAFNRSKNYFSFHGGSVLEFFSADRIQKALGARRWLLYGNEINSLRFEIWDELARRSDLVLGDFNPTAEFWLEKFLGYYENTIVIRSNYLNNPLLPDEERKRIELRASLDSNFRRTHVEVEYGSLEGLIFADWNQVDEMPRQEECRWVVYGLDFGFTNDPTAMIRVALKDEELWLDEMIYRPGLLTSELAILMRSMGVTKSDEVIADNKPEAIVELRRAELQVKAAYKPGGSVVAGIDVMKGHKIRVTKRSVNLIKELRSYAWKVDATGKPMNEPVDKFNHAIDAVRYAVLAKKLKGGRMRISKFSRRLVE